MEFSAALTALLLSRNTLVTSQADEYDTSSSLEYMQFRMAGKYRGYAHTYLCLSAIGLFTYVLSLLILLAHCIHGAPLMVSLPEDWTNSAVLNDELSIERYVRGISLYHTYVLALSIVYTASLQGLQAHNPAVRCLIPDGELNIIHSVGNILEVIYITMYLRD